MHKPIAILAGCLLALFLIPDQKEKTPAAPLILPEPIKAEIPPPVITRAEEKAA